jgi:hypothetical protein
LGNGVHKVITIIILAVLFAVSTSAVVMFLATRMVDDRAARIAFFITGAATPVLAIVAIVRFYALRKRPDVRPCPDLLASIEREIEEERVEIFGGKPLSPSLAESWQVAYLQSLERTASRVGSVFGALNSTTSDKRPKLASV